MHLFLFVLTSLLLAVAVPAQGRTLYVPSQYATIQAAIDAAAAKDTVLVAPGTYVETIDFRRRAITVRSSDGPAVTTIDGNKKGSVVTFVGGETRDSVLEGFTITGGTGTLIPGLGYGGGGIYCNRSSPTIRNNVITKNSVAGPDHNGGGGIVCIEQASPLISGNTVSYNTITAGGNAGGGGIIAMANSAADIVDNTVFENSVSANQLAGGGGIVVYSSGGTVARNVIFRNRAAFGGGMQLDYDATPKVESNVLFANHATGNGGGIQFYYASINVDFVNNTIYGNSAVGYGGGIYVNAGSHPTVRNGIVWNNKAGKGAQIAVLDIATLTIAYSDVQGGKSAAWVDPTASLRWGSGMMDRDPLFVAAVNGDLALRSGSACVDAGDPATQPCFATELYGNPRLLDGNLDGNMRIDMGACELTNVHLEVRGPARPGTTLVFETTGKPGLEVFLIMATAPGQVCFRPFGGLLFDARSPWLLLPWGQIPSRAQLAIPADVATPTSLVFQEWALQIPKLTGNVSNAVSLTIR